MKVAITAQGDTPASAVDPRFGRCQYLLLADTEAGTWRAVPNPTLNEPGGVGIALSQYLAQEKVEALVTGNVGPNAARALAAAGIGVYLAPGGSAGEALAAFQAGRLSAAGGPTVKAHSGL